MKTKNETNETTLPDHWKLRIFVRGCGVIHIISRVEPSAHVDDGDLAVVHYEQINCPASGDHLAYINWNDVSAVSWRFSPANSKDS